MEVWRGEYGHCLQSRILRRAAQRKRTSETHKGSLLSVHRITKKGMFVRKVPGLGKIIAQVKQNEKSH